jgi:uncharacterized membrane protein YbhN (UPF0104 family)
MLRRASRLWACVRLAIAAGILGVLLWRLGTRPVMDALGRIDLWTLGAALALAVPTTVCCAWRWRIVSRGLGSDLSLPAAVAAYYRSQFLNTVLPGGVLGDVHRAVSRGRDVGDVRHGVRVVVWERAAGQVVQVALTAVVLLVLPSPVRSGVWVVAAVAVAGLLVAVPVCRRLPRRGPTALARTVRTVAHDLRHGVLAPQAWPGVVVASTVVVAGHTATFLVAARTAGTTTSMASTLQLLPLALLVLLAMAVPTNIAGWGPREGVAAWVFALAGLGAAQGLATTVVYGAMAIVATLPGAALLLTSSLRPRRAEAADSEAEPVVPASGLGGEVASVRR